MTIVASGAVPGDPIAYAMQMMRLELTAIEDRRARLLLALEALRKIDAGETASPVKREPPAPIREPEPKPTASEPTASAAPRLADLRSPERDALMRETYPTVMRKEDIVARLNALPGPSFPTERLGDYAATLSLRRPKEYLQAVGAEAGRRAHARPMDQLSVAARLMRDEDENRMDTTINLDGAVEWGERMGLQGLKDMQFAEAVRAVNAERERHQLPRFRVIVPAAGA